MNGGDDSNEIEEDSSTFKKYKKEVNALKFENVRLKVKINQKKIISSEIVVTRQNDEDDIVYVY